MKNIRLSGWNYRGNSYSNWIKINSSARELGRSKETLHQKKKQSLRKFDFESRFVSRTVSLPVQRIIQERERESISFILILVEFPRENKSAWPKNAWAKAMDRSVCAHSFPASDMALHYTRRHAPSSFPITVNKRVTGRFTCFVIATWARRKRGRRQSSIRFNIGRKRRKRNSTYFVRVSSLSLLFAPIYAKERRED